VAPEKIVGNGEPEHRVAEKFKPLIMIGGAFPVLIRKGTVVSAVSEVLYF
jgi:hypothetical protein